MDKLKDSLITCKFCYLSVEERYNHSVVTKFNKSSKPNSYSGLDDPQIFSIDKLLEHYKPYNHSLSFALKKKKNITKIRCVRNYGYNCLFPDIVPHLSKLSSLNLNGLTLSDHQVMKISLNCTKLSELVLGVNNKVTCQTLNKLYSSLPTLAHVTLINHCCGKDGNCFSGLSSNVSKLSLISCKITKRTLFVKCIVQMKLLMKLHLGNCEGLPADLISFLIREQPTLQSLKFNISDKPPHFRCDTFLQYPNNLMVLNLLNNSQVDDDLLSNICDYCPQLESLLVGFLPFNELNVNQLENSKMNGFISLSEESISKLQQLKNLKTLGLFNLFPKEENNNFLNGVRYCKNLETLCFRTMNRDITDIACAVSTELDNLIRLTLFGYKITRTHIKTMQTAVKESGKWQKRLGVRRCIELTLENGCFDKMILRGIPKYPFRVSESDVHTYVQGI